MIEWLHPIVFFVVGALLLSVLQLPVLRSRVPAGLRAGLVLGVPLLALADLFLMTPGRYGVVSLLVGGPGQLVFGHVDWLSLAFAVIFVLMAGLGNLYALEGPSVGHHAAALLYAGGALGVVFAGDVLTWYLFWELMAVSSVLLIWFQPGAAAGRAGFRYLMVHLFAGVCLLGGIVLEGHARGSWALVPPAPGGLAGNLILIGLLLNAAIPPLHAWLTDAYPEATPWGAVFLSAFTTKTAVYSLARLFAGTEALIWLGAAAAVYGLVYAVLQNDLRRRLAYHLVSHVGAMVAAIGIGTPLAINGAVAMAWAGLLANGLLFMVAGYVMTVTGRRNLTDLGGLAARMPLMGLVYLAGALSVSSVPLFGGFVAESMVVAAAHEAHQSAVWLILTLTSAGTFLSLGLQVPAVVCLGQRGQPDQGGRPICAPSPRSMRWAMGVAAALCVTIGLVPDAFYAVLPYPVEHAPYTASHIVGALELLAATAAAFIWWSGRLAIRPGITLDTDWVYRRLGRRLAIAAGRITAFRARVTPDLWGDWVAQRVVVTPVRAVSRFCLLWDLTVMDRAVIESGRAVVQGGRLSSLFEKYVIYGLINVTAHANHVAAAALRKIQSGQVQHYALIMTLAALILITLVLTLGLRP